MTCITAERAVPEAVMSSLEHKSSWSTATSSRNDQRNAETFQLQAPSKQPRQMKQQPLSSSPLTMLSVSGSVEECGPHQAKILPSLNSDSSFSSLISSKLLSPFMPCNQVFNIFHISVLFNLLCAV